MITINEKPPDTQVLGGAVGGLDRGDVPRIVRNLLQDRRQREIELTIRPEVIGGYYTVEWQYLTDTAAAGDWTPRTEDDPDDGME